MQVKAHELSLSQKKKSLTKGQTIPGEGVFVSIVLRVCTLTCMWKKSVVVTLFVVTWYDVIINDA